MALVSLFEFWLDLLRSIHSKPLEMNFFEGRLGELLSRKWTYEQVADNTPFVNVVAMATVTGDKRVVHMLDAASVALIHDTDLHALPGQVPNFLSDVWLIEGQNQANLFGETFSLGGYTHEGFIYLLGFQRDGSCFVTKLAVDWEEQASMEAIKIQESFLVRNISHDRYATISTDAISFAVKFALLKEAEGTPLTFRSEQRRLFPRKPGVKKAPPSPMWELVHVAIDPEKVEPQGQVKELGAATVPVRGHIKRQRFGPGYSQSKLIYVSAYLARRWVKGGEEEN